MSKAISPLPSPPSAPSPQPASDSGGPRVAIPQLVSFLAMNRSKHLAFARKHGAPEPEDCIQEAAIDLFRKVVNGEVENGPDRNLTSLTYTLIARTAIDQIRRHRNPPKVVIDDHAEPDAAPIVVDWMDPDLAVRRRMVQRGLETLTPEERAMAAALVERGGLAEYARAIGEPVSTVVSQAKVFRNKLRSRLAWLQV